MTDQMQWLRRPRCRPGIPPLSTSTSWTKGRPRKQCNLKTRSARFQILQFQVTIDQASERAIPCTSMTGQKTTIFKGRDANIPKTGPSSAPRLRLRLRVTPKAPCSNGPAHGVSATNGRNLQMHLQRLKRISGEG